MMKRTMYRIIAVAALFGLVATGVQAQRFTVEEMFPEEPDPFMGNWRGRWSEEEDVDPEITAQVISLGRDRYEIRLAPMLFMRARPLVTIEARAEDGVLRFDEQHYHGEIRGDRFTGGRGRGRTTFEMTRCTYAPPRLGAPPPENAIVLFDGTNLDAWENTENWEIVDDAVMALPDSDDLVSKQSFKDVKLHVEFRTPYQPTERGQSRGNSGVFLQDIYEVQVLDSYGLEGYYDECGALYKVSAPYVNATLPPAEWQTFEITYRAARFDEDGEVVDYPRMTVLHNGYIVQHEQAMPWRTAWRERDRLQPPPTEPGPIRLQSHRAYYVQFRNVWLVELD